MVVHVKVVICPKCGIEQVTTALKQLNCKSCNKTTTLQRGKNSYMKVKVLKDFNDAGKASEWLRLYKEQKNKKENNPTGFFNCTPKK